MIDFLICAATNYFRIYCIYRFIKMVLDKTAPERGKIFFAYACFFVINTALFWIFHTRWINVVCNLIGISGIVRLYTKSVKTNIFVTGIVYLINMGCDIVGTFLFIQYEDGQRLDQIYAVIPVFMILVCLLLAGKILTRHKNVEGIQNVSLVLVPICSIAVICLLIYSDTCEETGIIIVTLGLLAINFLMLFLYNLLLRSVVQKYETEMLKSQVQIYANQLDVIAQSEDKVKALRHDMKHHMKELKLLAGKYDAREIRDYVERMEDFLHNPQEIVSSGNLEIDSVLNYMLQKAKAELETVIVKVILPEEIKHSFDLNVLIGNLLENAIEAAGQTDSKYLNVNIAFKKGVLRIQIDNSYVAGDVREGEERNGGKTFLTTKKGKEQHGIGLKNVKKIVESYNGNMDIQTGGGIFSVNLILYMSEIENGLHPIFAKI